MKELSLKIVVVTMDQALCDKAAEIDWKSKLISSNMVLRMGVLKFVMHWLF